MKRILWLGTSLMIVCLIAAGALGLTYALTKEQIARQAREEEARAFKEALPQVKRTRDFKERKDIFAELKEKYEDLGKISDGYANGQKVGVAVKVLPRGYGGFIEMVVGVNMRGKVVRIALVRHSETPGLGSNIENRSFQKQFWGKTANEPIEIGKDIDAITGATKSSKAMAKGIKEALEMHEEAMR